MSLIMWDVRLLACFGTSSALGGWTLECESTVEDTAWVGVVVSTESDAVSADLWECGGSTPLWHFGRSPLDAALGESGCGTERKSLRDDSKAPSSRSTPKVAFIAELIDAVHRSPVKRRRCVADRTDRAQDVCPTADIKWRLLSPHATSIRRSESGDPPQVRAVCQWG